MTEYCCHACNRTYPIDTLRYKCDCGGVLNLKKEESHFPLEEISRRSSTLWRYREAIPVDDDSSIVPLGEGMTPLLPFENAGCEHYLKLDFITPTGSYKDRGASVLLSKLVELGVREVVEDSSGNAGAAVAAYCARAGIGCTIYCPASTSKGKLAQIGAYGGRLKLIEGNRAATTEAVLKAAETTYYASHNWNPFFLEGTKTVAFEIAEQLGWKAPDHVICPIGFGSVYLGAYIGFRELCARGIVDRVPRLLGVQSAACSPVYTAYSENGRIKRTPQTYGTLAEGIAAEYPIRGEMILEARRKTGGAFTIVSEEDIQSGIKILARRGVYVEPTSAVVVKAFDKFVEEGIIGLGDTVVSILTGSGLKATEKLMKVL
ncbi:MAG: threonine synthase [Candidatus Poribacteria bacterium]|nr:threonine synthase [Candidatus Poribacteria bacterium]